MARQHTVRTPSPIVVAAIRDALQSASKSHRSPDKAAAILALIVDLYERNEPFPTRQAVAKAVNSSVFTVDAVLSSKIDEGYLTLAIETSSGNVARRPSTVTKRFFIPSKPLITLAKEAESRYTRKKVRVG